MRKLTLSLAIMAAMLPGRGYPLGLGEIELHSALNQELDAEIEVLSSQLEDADQLIIKLASREAFARAGIDRPYLLQQLRFKIIVKDGKPFVKIVTKSPIREPFLSFLVEIDWPQGHLLREYTLLLDPPVFTQGNATQTSSTGDDRPFIDPAGQSKTQSANPSVSSYSSGQVSPNVIAHKEADGSISYKTAPQSQAQNKSPYRVKQHDTLWSLSNKMRPDASVSVEQMMLALARENPEAFIEGNINGLKRGYILRMPDRDSINSLDRQQALANAREHSALWRQYRESQTAITPASSLASQSAKTPAPAADVVTDGQLSIVSPNQANGSDTSMAGQDPDADQLQKLRAELALAREELESTRLEKEGLQSHLSDLEQRVQNVLQMDESELAQLQQDLQGTKEPVPAPESLIEEPAAVEMEAAQEEVATDETLAATDIEAENVSEESITDEITAEADVDALFVDETTNAEELMAETEPAAVEPVADVPAFVQPTKPKSFIEKILEDPGMLAAIGGGLLALFALIGVLLRRRRVNENEDEWVANDSGSIENSIDDIDVEATVQTQAVASDLTDTTEQPSVNFDDTQIDSPSDDILAMAEEPEQEQGDDVLAEADVYLAYGIYQQAEELLSGAIKDNPERDDYRMKLLETHFASKDSAAFASLATETHARKADDQNYWGRVAAMGSELCPDNELFSGGGELSAFDTEDLLPEKPQTPDLDLDAGDADLSSDLDLGLDEDFASETSSDEAEATQILGAPIDLDMALPDEAESDEVGDLLDDTELEFDLGDFGEEDDDNDLSANSTLDDVLDESLEDSLDDSLDEPMADLEDPLDLGEIDEPMDALEEDTTAENELDIDEDFSLDFEASDLGFEDDDDDAELTEESDVVDSLEEASAEFDVDVASDKPADEVSMDSLDMDMDLGLDDADLMDTEIADSDLDAVEALEEEGLESDFDISSLSDDVDEVATKLDLAKAYIDMGDSDGAKSILEEVKQEGSDEQKKLADDLLKQAS